MLDNRIYTFLELCSVMNYHKTAENLNMTQPAVSQHIKFLEEYYNCKLFSYSNRKLRKTKKGLALEKYSRNIVSMHLFVKQELSQRTKTIINIGATKTIGEYLLNKVIPSFLLSDEYEFNFIVDNTDNLLNKLNHFELDLLLLEGYVDKEKYLHTKIIDEEIIGICSLEHPFAYKEVDFKQVLDENIILRESGSGTKTVFEHFLSNHGYSIDNFKHKSVISSNKIIENSVQNGLAISFVYKVIEKQNDKLAFFRIKNNRILHEFNFVFLNPSKAQKIIDIIVPNIYPH